MTLQEINLALNIILVFFSVVICFLYAINFFLKQAMSACLEKNKELTRALARAGIRIEDVDKLPSD